MPTSSRKALLRPDAWRGLRAGQSAGAATPPGDTGVAAERRARPAAARIRLGATQPSTYLFALIALTVTGMGLGTGGYFPPAWGWSGLTCSWVAAAAFLIRKRATTNRAQVVMAAGIAGYTAWCAISLLWSPDLTIGVEDLQRTLMYLCALLAAISLSSRSTSATRDALFAGTTLVCLYSVATRLFPDTLGLYTSVATPGRLFNPLGYWNAQGVFAAFAVLLAAGVAVGRGRPACRAAAAALVPLLALDCYFTFSRGAVAALAIGLVAWLIIDPSRLRTGGWLLLLAPWTAIAVLQAHSMPELAGRAFGLASAPSGHRLALTAVVVGVVGGLVVFVLARNEHRVKIGRRVVSLLVGCAIVFVLLGAVATIARYGSPAHLVRAAYSAALAPPPRVDNAGRVESLSLNGRPDLWRVAWTSGKAHPIAGAGIGSFESTWLRNRPTPGDDRWAHSLYLETFSETGIIGLALLLIALCAPIVSVIPARKDRLVPPLFGVYVAFLVHAGTDWDWQMPALTLVALWAAAAITAVEGRSRPLRLVPGKRRWLLATVAVSLGTLAAAGLVGNWNVERSQAAAARGNYTEAETAASTAARWQPWSYRPWMELGDARRAQGELAGARLAYLTAADRDPARWEPWFALGQIGVSARNDRALMEQATRRNPLSNQIAHYCRVNKIPSCERRYFR